MEVAVLYSGGKDSTYAVYWALNQGWRVKHLVSFLPARDDSFMFHTPCVELTRLQSEAMSLPYVGAKVSGVAEKEVSEMADALARLKVDGVVSGALASDYQKTRVDGVCEKIGVPSFAPLWHKNPIQLLEDIARAGFEVVFSGVCAEGFDEKWLGRKLDRDCIRDLAKLAKKHGVHPAGEGGEYETLVVDGPTFRKKIAIEESCKKWDGVRGKLIVESATLKEKQDFYKQPNIDNR